MRCLAIAQAWRDAGGQVTWGMARGAEVFETRLEREGMEAAAVHAQPGTAEDATATVALAESRSAAWLVIDGYAFQAEYQRLLKKSDVPVLCVDDAAASPHYYADIVLNQNMDVQEELYEAREPSTKLLLGPRFALLRREFWRWRGHDRVVAGEAKKVMVMIGGADEANVTRTVMGALDRLAIPDAEVRVAIGPLNPHEEDLRRVAAESATRFTFESFVCDVTELMAWADVAVSGGGTACLELAFMGVPACVVVVADNQRQAVEALHRRGLVLCAGWYAGVDVEALATCVDRLVGDAELRRQMSVRGRAQVPGTGAFAVVTAMLGEPARAGR